LNILKKTYSKNNNEIVLIEAGGIAIPPYCQNEDQQSMSGIPARQPKTVLIIGVVHGDEPQGKFLIEKYLKTNEEMLNEAKNRLLFIPCINPDGLKNKSRQNANLVDINRNFPTNNWELTEKNEYFGGDTPASEIETKFVTEIVEKYTPDAILTFHAPYKVVNYDGPAEKIAQEISKIINYPTQQDIGYPTPGSFGTYAGIERHIPTITLELDEKTDLANLTKPVFEIFAYLSTFTF